MSSRSTAIAAINICAQQRQRSACASAETDQSLPWTHKLVLSLAFHTAYSEDFEQTAQADLSLRLAHKQIVENGVPRLIIMRFCVCVVECTFYHAYIASYCTSIDQMIYGDAIFFYQLLVFSISNTM